MGGGAGVVTKGEGVGESVGEEVFEMEGGQAAQTWRERSKPIDSVRDR